MIQDKKTKCVVCHAYLFEEDDVVYCPECGAPHHRECYNSIGECGLAQHHGTENQYDKLKQEQPQEEPEQNGEEQTSYKEQPPFTQSPFGQYTTIDFLGGVKPQTVIEDGVTAKDAAKFVVSNTMRYIPKFVRGRKTSWNFMAFLFPCGWFLSRKMYKNGIIAGVLQIVASLLTIPYQNTLDNLGISELPYNELANAIIRNMDKIPSVAVAVAFLGGLLGLAVCILSGIFGDWLYKKHTVSTIRKIKEKSEDIEADFHKKGGVNIFMILIGYFGIRLVFTIILSII